MADTKATINISITGTDICQVQAMVLSLADRLGGESIGSVKMDAETPAAEITFISPTAKPEPEPEPEPEAVSDVTPAEAKERGIKAVQTYFAENPDSLSEITAIQKKYNVKMFTDIKENNAIDFLADVMLLTAGAPSA
jgi:hypothetical protein